MIQNHSLTNISVKNMKLSIFQSPIREQINSILNTYYKKIVLFDLIIILMIIDLVSLIIDN